MRNARQRAWSLGAPREGTFARCEAGYPTGVLEAGDVYFFYRRRIDVSRVDDLDDVARLYMVLAVRGAFRLFAVGRKRLPQGPRDRRWAVNLNGLTDLEPVRHELAGKLYATATRGRRHVSAATPVGQGAYQLHQRGKQTELVYALQRPEEPGPAQHTLEIRKQARYVVAVRNPNLSPRGARYPPELQERFEGRRWIPIDTPALLDTEGAELLLIGARAAGEVAHRDSQDLFHALQLKHEQVPLQPLLEGTFPDREDTPEQEIIRLPPPPRGRKVAAGSAAALAKRLRGVRFPMTSGALTDFALGHRASDVELGQLRELPERSFANMAEVAHALGELRNRGAPFSCPYCGEVFGEHTRYERHLIAAHPPRAPSAADVESAVAGIHYPKSRDELVRYAEEIRHAKSEIVSLLRELPEREYHDAKDLAVAFGDSIRKRA
jgi:hypothetical protein